jgi:ABC-type cobalt transport system substrate-binding protein
MNRFFWFDSQKKIARVLLIFTLLVFTMPVVSLLSQDAYAHSAVDSSAVVKTIDNKYQMAFQLFPKFASAGQNATLHFDILDEKGSNLVGVYAALVMKEKEDGAIVHQMPYRFYESSGNISMPYKFDDNSDYVATLLTRINDDPKYLATPLQADFDIPIEQTIVMSPHELLPQLVLVASGIIGGIVFALKKVK